MLSSRRPTWPSLCSTPIATILSSATATWPTRPATPATRPATAPCGGSAPPTAGGRRSARSAARTADRVRRSTTTSSSETSPPANRTSCGWPTSPSTRPPKQALPLRHQGRALQLRSWTTPMTPSMKPRLAVGALRSAVDRGGQSPGCILHTDRGSQFRSRKFVRALHGYDMVGSMGRVGAAGDNAAMESFFALLLQERPGPPSLGHSPAAAHGDRGLDRRHLPPAATPSRPGEIDPRRVRNHHDHTSQSGCLTRPVTSSCISPYIDAYQASSGSSRSARSCGTLACGPPRAPTTRVSPGHLRHDQPATRPRRRSPPRCTRTVRGRRGKQGLRRTAQDRPQDLQ